MKGIWKWLHVHPTVANVDAGGSTIGVEFKIVLILEPSV